MRRLETRLKRAERLANGNLNDFQAAFLEAWNSIKVPGSPLPIIDDSNKAGHDELPDDFFENLERDWKLHMANA